MTADFKNTTVVCYTTNRIYLLDSR